MIEFLDVTKSYGGKRAVSNLTMTIPKGELTILIGNIPFLTNA